MAAQARGANIGMAITTKAMIRAKTSEAFIVDTVYRYRK
jgi:hypothetical protein